MKHQHGMSERLELSRAVPLSDECAVQALSGKSTILLENIEARRRARELEAELAVVQGRLKKAEGELSDTKYRLSVSVKANDRLRDSNFIYRKRYEEARGPQQKAIKKIEAKCEARIAKIEAKCARLEKRRKASSRLATKYRGQARTTKKYLAQARGRSDSLLARNLELKAELRRIKSEAAP